MNLFARILVVLTIAFAVGTTCNLVQAGCGSCEKQSDHPHDHEHKDTKERCIRCEHSETCDVINCDDPAHNAECICPKK